MSTWPGPHLFALFHCGYLLKYMYMGHVHMVKLTTALQWRHNGHNSVSNHQPHECLLNRLFRRRSKNTSKLRVTGLCAENSPGTGEFSAQMAITRKMFPFDDVIMAVTSTWESDLSTLWCYRVTTTGLSMWASGVVSKWVAKLEEEVTLVMAFWWATVPYGNCRKIPSRSRLCNTLLYPYPGQEMV